MGTAESGTPFYVVIFNSLCLTHSVLQSLSEREENKHIALLEKYEAERVGLLANTLRAAADSVPGSVPPQKLDEMAKQLAAMLNDQYMRIQEGAKALEMRQCDA